MRATTLLFLESECCYWISMRLVLNEPGSVEREQDAVFVALEGQVFFQTCDLGESQMM
jgi:hypothetical protein